MPVNHDVAWTLWLAQQVLAGRELYRDLIEINPPLVVWLNLPIVRLAAWLGISPYAAYYTALVLMLAGCSGFALRLLPDRPVRAGLLLVLVLGPLAGADFGQRENLCVGLLLPILALALQWRTSPATPRSTTVSIIAGLLAAVAIALKPFLAPVWLVLIPYRRLRFEDAVVMMFGVLYLGSVLLYSPNYLPLTRTLMETYLAFNRQGWGTMLVHPVGAVLLVTGAGWFYMAGRGIRSPLATLCLLAAAGAWLGAAVQRKGWGYHWYPATAFLVLAAMAIYQSAAAAPSGGGAVQGLRPRRVATYLIASVAILLVGRIWVTAEALSERRFTIALMRQVARPGDRVLVLSSRVSDAWPSVPLSGATWAGRLPSAWFAQADGLHPPATMENGERLLYDTMVEDFLAGPERLIVETPQLNGRRLRRPGFDVLAYLRQDNRAAVELGRYSERARVGGMAIWIRR